MTSLAAQLQVVASAAPQEERLKGKASLLYELKEAADIDLATIYAVGLQGASRTSRPARGGDRLDRRRRPLFRRLAPRDFATAADPIPHRRLRAPRVVRAPPRLTPPRVHPPISPGFTELCRLDGRFEAYSRTLFSRAASESNRELLDRDANAKLDVTIEGYLRLLSGYFLNPAAAKTLEYLVRRYKIHVYNVEAAVTCALPYHSTPDFVKLVQLANLEGTSFYFLKHVKERGAAPPRDQLVARCVNDPAFLSFVCDAAAASASAKVRPGPTPAFPSERPPIRLPSEKISRARSPTRNLNRELGYLGSETWSGFVSSGRVSRLASRLSARSRRFHRLFFRLMRLPFVALNNHAATD